MTTQEDLASVCERDGITGTREALADESGSDALVSDTKTGFESEYLDGNGYTVRLSATRVNDGWFYRSPT